LQRIPDRESSPEDYARVRYVRTPRNEDGGSAAAVEEVGIDRAA
jgi:hypothetical protein